MGIHGVYYSVFFEVCIMALCVANQTSNPNILAQGLEIFHGGNFRLTHKKSGKSARFEKQIRA